MGLSRHPPARHRCRCSPLLPPPGRRFAPESGNRSVTKALHHGFGGRGCEYFDVPNNERETLALDSALCPAVRVDLRRLASIENITKRIVDGAALGEWKWRDLVIPFGIA